MNLLSNMPAGLPETSKAGASRLRNRAAASPCRLFSRSIITLALATAMIAVVCGCNKGGKAIEPTQADAVAVNPEAPPDTQEKARVSQLVAMRAGVEPPPPALKLRGGELATPEVLAAYNQELLRARYKMGESPETLEELNTKWVGRWRVLPPLPTPPRGKRLVYDIRNSIIRLDPP